MDIVDFQGHRRPASYLGDAVYAIFDGYGIWLLANDHRAELASDKIFLEPSVLEALNNFNKQLTEQVRKDGK